MVEWNGLENRHTRKGIAGSNPVFSATFKALMLLDLSRFIFKFIIFNIIIKIATDSEIKYVPTQKIIKFNDMKNSNQDPI